MLACSNAPPQANVNPLVTLPLWIQFDGAYIPLRGEEQISLACQLACVYHNGPDCRAPSEDGWDEDTLASEEKAIEHMLAEASDEDLDTDVD